VECQRALVRAFEGRSSGNSNWGCLVSLGGDGLDGYASYAAMPKREREKNCLVFACLNSQEQSFRRNWKIEQWQGHAPLPECSKLESCVSVGFVWDLGILIQTACG
jgi:hypothetical protein